MSYILSDDGICEACPASEMRTCDSDGLRCEVGTCLVHPDFKRIAKAQARHLLNLLKEPCTEHQTVVVGGSYNNGNIIRRTRSADHRYLCPECMAKIEEALKYFSEVDK